MTTSSAKLSAIFFISSFLLFSSLLSFSAYADNGGFSFIEFNLAYVLGLCLPTLLVVLFANRVNAISIRTPILLMGVLLVLLFGMSYLIARNDSVVITLAAIILQLNCTWAAQLHTIKNNSKVASRSAWLFAMNLLLLFTFLITLWFGLLALSQAWIIFSVVQLALHVVSIAMSGLNSNNMSRRFWLLTSNYIVYCVVVYIYLTQQLSMELLAAFVVASCTVSFASGCWQLISFVRVNEVDEKQLLPVAENINLDPATNLPSYQFALNKFEHGLKKHTAAKYAVITFKPVNFQQVNSVLGHHNSDILLLQLAYCLQKSVEADESLFNFASHEQPVRVARLQGLHFLVIIDVAKHKHDDEIIIEELCKKLADAVPGPMSFKSFSLFFKLVFGVAFVGKDSSNVSEVIACAEDALLQADKQQKLVCFFAQELAIFNEQQLQKMEHLKQDILADKILWQIQPQIQMASKKLIAFELVVSWQHKHDETLTFNDIMHIAQQSGDAYLLCQQMVVQAFVYLKALHAAATLVPIAIKISKCCILEPDLVDYIEQQAEAHKIDCQYLLLEIEEDILLSETREAKASIDQLKSLGVKVAIDEFSGSYEALRYLRRMAVSEIKINCQSLAQVEAGSSDKAIINALINLTRKMELPLIGTNINNAEIEKMFLAMGGEYAQGKFYSMGITAQELPAWLNSWYQQYPQSRL